MSVVLAVALAIIIPTLAIALVASDDGPLTEDAEDDRAASLAEFHPFHPATDITKR